MVMRLVFIGHLYIAATISAITLTVQTARQASIGDLAGSELKLAQAESEGFLSKLGQGAMKLGEKLLGGSGGGGEKCKQNAPNVNVVDNMRVMIPEGADPTAVKLIIGDIMDRGIGGVKGALNIMKKLGGEKGLTGL